MLSARHLINTRVAVSSKSEIKSWSKTRSFLFLVGKDVDKNAYVVTNTAGGSSHAKFGASDGASRNGTAGLSFVRWVRYTL